MIAREYLSGAIMSEPLALLAPCSRLLEIERGQELWLLQLEFSLSFQYYISKENA